VLPLGGFGHGVMEELKAQTPDEPRVEGVGAWLGLALGAGVGNHERRFLTLRHLEAARSLQVAEPCWCKLQLY